MNDYLNDICVYLQEENSILLDNMPTIILWNDTFLKDIQKYHFNIELKENHATVLVPMHVHKKHLKENYNDLIQETFAEITGTNFQFEYVTKEEVEQNIEIDTDNVGVPAINEYESNLNPLPLK